MERVMHLKSQRVVVIFSKNSCCMCHTVKPLFSGIGVNSAVYELDKDPRRSEMERVLSMLGLNLAVPAVFIGGELVGGTHEVMTLHLKGTLIPLLK